MKKQLLAIWILIARKSFQNFKLPENYCTIVYVCQGNIHLMHAFFAS